MLFKIFSILILTEHSIQLKRGDDHLSLTLAEKHLAQFKAAHRIQILAQSSATVAQAASALQCEPARIAKSLTFSIGEDVILIVAAGDAKIDNKKFKQYFGVKAKMLAPDEVETRVGHAVGGVCPFGVPDVVTIFLDASLNRFDTVFPACGTSNSAIELSISELEQFTNYEQWIDIAKGWQEHTPS